MTRRVLYGLIGAVLLPLLCIAVVIGGGYLLYVLTSIGAAFGLAPEQGVTIATLVLVLMIAGAGIGFNWR